MSLWPLKGTRERRHSSVTRIEVRELIGNFRGPIRRRLTVNKTSKFFFFLAALLTIAAALILQSLDNAQAAPGETAIATYTSGTLRVTIPFHGLHAGAGELTVEVLDPEDGVLGRAERRVDAAEGAGSWREEISFDKALAKPPSVDDLAASYTHLTLP